jgi:hypothetical protein
MQVFTCISRIGDDQVRSRDERARTPDANSYEGDDRKMQYLFSVLDDTAGLATAEEDAAIDVFNDRLQSEGYWVFAGGLAAPSAATVIDNRGDEALLIDGPFVETKEHVAGLWIIEAPDLDVALQLATEGSRACNRRIEVRPILQAP